LIEGKTVAAEYKVVLEREPEHQVAS